MGDQQAWLVRYQVMAQLRMHFSQLFFSTVFATLAVAFGIGFAGWMLLPTKIAYVCFAIAANFAFGVIIARRLLLRERGCFAEMQAAWRTAQSQTGKTAATGKTRPGAMDMLLWAMAAFAILLTVTGLRAL
jgi:hypothetical protein